MSDKKYPFGAVVRERRLALGLTQEALAERAGVSLRWIQLIERGRQQPSVLSFFRLAQGLDCEAGLLIREFQAVLREAESLTDDA